jgi:hypothetical protein
MGIRIHCPNGHRLNVKAFLAGKRGICPKCGARFDIPLESEVNHHAPQAQWAPSANTPTPTLPVSAAQSDPIAESPDAVWYVRTAAGGEYGPASGDVMKAWLAEGRVTSDSWVWRDGWPEWRQASTSFPQFASPTNRMKAIVPPAPPSAPVATATTSAPWPDPHADDAVVIEEVLTVPEFSNNGAPAVDPLTATTMRHAAARESFRRHMLVMTAILIASAIILVVVAVYLLVVKQSAPPKAVDDNPPAVSSSSEPARSPTAIEQ